MTLETFFGKFDQFADAPDAVAKMRELVLQLAIQGRLVGQVVTDEPATTLATQIAEDRAAFVKERCIARQRVYAAIVDDQCPFALPSGWDWTRLGNLCRVQAGFAFQSAAFVQDDSGVPMIRIRDITKERTQVNYVGEYREEFLIEPGDYLVGMDGNFTVARWRGPRALLNQRVSRLQWYSQRLEPAFFAVALQHRLSELQGTKAYTTVDHLSSGQIEDAVVPLPPLAEQKRIVAKVDELMALCDRLEALEEVRQSRHGGIARASLARFADAPTPANLQFLFHPSYAIPPADLRKSILTLAVQGKLVPQDPNDKSAEEFIATVRTAARESGYRGRSNSEDDSNPKFVAHVPDELPAGWSVCPLEDLFKFIDYRGRTPVRCSSGVRLITAKNVKKGFVSNEPVEFIADDVYPNWMTRGFPKKGDLLFVTEGHTMGFVGTLDFDFKYALAQRTIDLQPVSDGYGPFYLYYLLSEPFQTAVLSNTTGSAAQGIKAAKLKRIRVIVPPLAEQRRIVTTVEQLMALVDALETQLAASRTTAANLLSALVAELTAG